MRAGYHGAVDDATLASLRAALAESQDNVQLRMVLVRAHLARDETPQARELLGDRLPEALPTADDRVCAAEVLVGSGEPERALAFAAEPTSARGRLARARALHALGRAEEALSCYREAIAENATLEDPQLQALLGVARREEMDSTESVPRLRVIANDDTDATEVDRLLRPEPRRVTFADVGGLADVKQQIERRIVLPFQKPALFNRFRKRVGGGILLYGPPGCGKTLLARATAGEVGATFFNVGISDVLDMYIGESERKLHAIFEKARQSAPAVLFFDELEALAGKRHFTREGHTSKLVSQFLSEMDGFAERARGVLILGATNVPWALDPAFRRPGRFDRVLFVPPPDREARRAILGIHVADRPAAADLGLEALARQTSGFSGADLEHLVETATDLAIEESLADGTEVPLSRAHLSTALGQVRPTTLEWLTTARNHARYANEGGQYDAVLEFLERHGRK
jgi:SpoVK/Ycf46/Vps4 family AAA+-type ATPase